MGQVISGFGELLLRLSPQGHEDLIVQSDALEMGFAGAEANILADLSHWGQATQFITALPENPLGKKALMFLNQHGVGTQNIHIDQGRVGTYYIEHGTAIRGTQVTYDRKESSFSKWDLSEKDWENFLDNKKKNPNKNSVKKKDINKSDKDKQDWENFLNTKEKIPNKDFVHKQNIRYEKIKKIDLHGYTIEEANKAVEQFIQKCFDEDVTKIIVITGKGLRSKNVENPYLSRDLSILKYSVPEFIENNKILIQLIIETTDAKIEDGGSGAFYIYLKNKNKFK